MASSSSTGRWTYEVFLSFRGEDTRNNFVDHLYTALNPRVPTFKDDEMLRKGDPISPELLKAIEESKCAVVVFSVNYGNSSWCLEELAKIMECRNQMGQRVLPVFYHVDPSDVRRQNGEFGMGFQKQINKFSREPEKLNKWKEALVAASNLSGFHVSKSVGGESEFINKIVEDILGHVSHYPMENNFIGLEPHMDKLSSLLDLEATEKVRFIGIWGMGGIGKTTIAQAIFRRIAYKFEASSFVKDVRANSTNNKDICKLQLRIMQDVMIRRYLYYGFQDPFQGANEIQRNCSRMKVLLVLDDVDNVNQIEFLAARHEWFGPGSRIIITTRDLHLLSHADETFEPGHLHMDQAVELFSRYAFRKSSPPEAYKELSLRAISYTGHLPLALKVLGSFFHGRHADVWESALNRLHKAPNIEIFETLRLSFDGLHDFEKKIFLDIACFFKGKDKENVTRILDSFGFDPIIGISVLTEKSLITVSNNRLDMHDLIQEMGWKIVRDNFSDSRIWQLKEMYDLMIIRTEKLTAIEAIVLPYKEDEDDVLMDCDEELDCSTEVFLSMKKLRLLDVYSGFSSNEPTFLPYELRWLCWLNYPFPSLPVKRMQKLVGIEMVNSNIKHLWDGRKNLQNLKFIDLRGSRLITRFPDVSIAPNIERLVLSGCRGLVEFHESLGSHQRLIHLDVSNCNQLKCLPSRINMESLETLILSHCHSLERFPEVSPHMIKLSNIYLDDCVELGELPSSIGNLSGLRFLNLMNCSNLKNIPNSICKLKHLKSLYLQNCEELQNLPEELGSMENLEELLLGFTDSLIQELSMDSSEFFIGCDELYVRWQPNSIRIHSLTSLCSLKILNLSGRQIEAENFPPNLHAFSSLEELNLAHNSMLTQLPAGISNHSCLKVLELGNCKNLKTLHGLPTRIQVLKAGGCSSLEKIEDLSEEYEWLYKIWLFDCHTLLQDQENSSYLDKMLQQSFLKRCAAVDHRLSIGIPGNKVPSWFKEEINGCDITLKLPPKCHTQIMGFAVCGVFRGDWNSERAIPKIIFKIVDEKRGIPESEVDISNTSVKTVDNGNMWISYIPFCFFQQMYHDLQPEDWVHIQGNLLMKLKRTDGEESVRCGARIMYKKDVESIQHNKICILDYGKLVRVDYVEDNIQYFPNTKSSVNTRVYEEKSDDKNLNQMPLRTRSSQIMDRTFDVSFYSVFKETGEKMIHVHKD